MEYFWSSVCVGGGPGYQEADVNFLIFVQVESELASPTFLDHSDAMISSNLSLRYLGLTFLKER